MLLVLFLILLLSMLFYVISAVFEVEVVDVDYVVSSVREFVVVDVDNVVSVFLRLLLMTLSLLLIMKS